MKCYNHSDNDVVATCRCNKGLCLSCTNKYATPSCDSCALIIARGSQSSLIKNIILTLVFTVLGISIFLNSKVHLLVSLFFIYLCAGIPWGWSALNRVTPNIFLFMPVVGWMIYFYIKLCLSCFVGLVALPWKIFEIAREWKAIKSIRTIASITK